MVQAQTIVNPTAPCTATGAYGTRTTRLAIETMMAIGTAADVVAAINNGKSAKGNEIGCSESSYSYNANVNDRRPTLAEIEARWNSVHVPNLTAYADSCPTLARDWSAKALGAYYARYAGYTHDINKLAEIAVMQVDTQFSTDTAAASLAQPLGSFGYLNTAPADRCFLDDLAADSTVGAIVARYCAADPSKCVTYTSGRFAGKNFQVADTDVTRVFSDGAMNFDHGWAGVMLIEAAINHPDAEQRKRFKAAALLAGEWARAEAPVRNHNYTAKLVWLLAELYALTGDVKWRDALVDKLERNLKPGVLLDQNFDGIVDGTTATRFADLNRVAQRPGRYWDSHNARPAYLPMNAWALVEAYVAFRDRSDAEQAAALKPYVIAVLDNISWEINNLGVPTSGTTQLPYALLLGLWKVADFENEPRPEWERAVWRLWNSGVGTTPGGNTVNTGLYLIYRSGARYVPLNLRQSPPSAPTTTSKWD